MGFTGALQKIRFWWVKVCQGVSEQSNEFGYFTIDIDRPISIAATPKPETREPSTPTALNPKSSKPLMNPRTPTM